MFPKKTAKLSDFDLMMKKSSADHSLEEINEILAKRNDNFFVPELIKFMRLLN